MVIAIAILQTISMVSVVQPAAFAEKIEGDEGPNTLVGTPGNDNIDSKGGNDRNLGDAVIGDGSGDDKINSGEGSDTNSGDTLVGDGSGDDKINSGKGDDVNFGDTDPAFGTGSGDDKINAGQGDDQLTGNGGADKFQCGKGEDTVTDFNEEEGDKATGNCENI